MLITKELFLALPRHSAGGGAQIMSWLFNQLIILSDLLLSDGLLPLQHDGDSFPVYWSLRGHPER